MKRQHMIAKTILMTVNVLFALYFFNMFASTGKVHQQTTYYALKVIDESGALDTNALTRYISSIEDSRFGYDPISSLKKNGDVTVGMFGYLIIPALCLLMANVIVMGLCWKRRIDQQE